MGLSEPDDYCRQVEAYLCRKNDGHLIRIVGPAFDQVRGWAGVIEARLDRGRLNITADDAEGVVRRLLAADPTLGRLEVRQAGLNEAFNELTRKEITSEAA